MLTEITLRRGALNTLNNLLQGTGWYADTKTAYIAGSVLVNCMPEMEDVPKQEDGRPISGAALKEWLDVENTLAMDKQQLSVCFKCVEHFLEQKKLTINPYTFELMDKLGMKPD